MCDILSLIVGITLANKHLSAYGMQVQQCKGHLGSGALNFNPITSDVWTLVKRIKYEN